MLLHAAVEGKNLSLSLSILIAKLEIIGGHASGCIIDALERCVD